MDAKKLFYIITVAAISSVVLSCSDDLLDKKPLEGYSELDVFADEALLDNYVSGTYRGFRHPFDDTENSLTDGLTDNAYNQHGSAESIIKVYTRAEVNPDDGEGVTRSLWSWSYSYIRRANLFFEKTVDSPITPATLAVKNGEMRFIRAYLYFELLRWYGDVPLITQTFDLTDESFDVTRTPADDVADFIVSECDAAIANLPSIADVGGSIPEYQRYQTGMASKEAAMALKARTLLYIASPLFNAGNEQSRWTAARDANKAVMDLTTVSLIDDADGSDYGAMFRGENSNEVIFARYFTQTNNQGWGVNLWLFPNSNGGWATTTPTQNLVDNYELTNGKVPLDPTSGYDDQDPYVNRDPRFYESILYQGAPFKESTYDYSVDKTDSTNKAKAGKDSQYSSQSPHNASRTGYNFRKYVQEDQGEYSGNTGPWIFFRKAEFYLNYAEAEIALGNEQEARDAINDVRSRVGMPDVIESGNDLVERYRRERNVELVLEDHRFFDMRRWKIGPETLGVPARRVSVYKNGSVIEYVFNGRVVVNDTRVWDDKMYLLPIPSSERQRSHNALSQNPGYSF